MTQASTHHSGLPVGMAPSVGVHGWLDQAHALVQGTRSVVHATGLAGRGWCTWLRWLS